MVIKKIMLALCLIALAQIGSAGEEDERIEIKEHNVMVFKTHDDQGSDEVRLDSNTMGFQLSELQEGETRTALTEDGRSVTLSKTNGEISLMLPSGRIVNLPSVDHKQGRKIHVMKMHGDHDEMSEDFAFDFDADIEIPEGITISSTTPLDDNTKQAIRNAIQAAGVSDPVNFSDHQIWIKTSDTMPGDVDHMVGKQGKMIRKVVKTK